MQATAVLVCAAAMIFFAGCAGPAGPTDDARPQKGSFEPRAFSIHLHNEDGGPRPRSRKLPRRRGGSIHAYFRGGSGVITKDAPPIGRLYSNC